MISESTGFNNNFDSFPKTLNNMGYMCTQLDLISKKFIKACCPGKKVLDVGAAYGVASIEALKRGANVVANDLDQRHLDILKSNCPKAATSRLITDCFDFPNGNSYPDDYFDGILISRVLHFFSPNKIKMALMKSYQMLKDKGKIFIISDTPYMKNWSDYLPIFLRKIDNKEPWPGLIQDSYKYATQRAKDRPRFVNLMSHCVLKRELELAGFVVEESRYINREDYPEDMVGTGRESAGAIGVKIAL